MAWPNIDVNTPSGSEKKKFGDDRIREVKQNTVDALQAISNYSPGGSKPALRTAVWDTAGRPSGANLVDRVSGYNTDLGCREYYDLENECWKQEGKALDSWTVSGRPVSPIVGQYGYNSDLSVIERWSGSAWVRISGGRRGDVKMWSGAVADIETGWCLADGVERDHPEGGKFTPPDLRNRFIVGAGSDTGSYTPEDDGVSNTTFYSPGDTGGEDKHTLVVAELAAHIHNQNPYTALRSSSGAASWGSNNGTLGGTTGSTGGDEAHENRPPYYALCFLYKL